MLIGCTDKEKKVVEVPAIKGTEERRILDFLKGAVYAHCSINPSEWFSFKDLFGKFLGNEVWKGIPLDVLYKKHIANGKSHKEAFDLAGKEAGKLLKKVIAKESLKFKTEKPKNSPKSPREYLLVE